MIHGVASSKYSSGRQHDESVEDFLPASCLHNPVAEHMLWPSEGPRFSLQVLLLNMIRWKVMGDVDLCMKGHWTAAASQVDRTDLDGLTSYKATSWV